MKKIESEKKDGTREQLCNTTQPATVCSNTSVRRHIGCTDHKNHG